MVDVDLIYRGFLKWTVISCFLDSFISFSCGYMVTFVLSHCRLGFNLYNGGRRETYNETLGDDIMSSRNYLWNHILRNSTILRNRNSYVCLLKRLLCGYPNICLNMWSSHVMKTTLSMKIPYYMSSFLDLLYLCSYKLVMLDVLVFESEDPFR